MEEKPDAPKSYKELTVWQQTRKLTAYIYTLTRQFPVEERYGLINQMQRAAISIPSDIAEGCGRQHPRDTIQFLAIARGSLYEIETQTYLAFDQQYIDEAQLTDACLKIEKCIQLLQGFIRYYRTL